MDAKMVAELPEKHALKRVAKVKYEIYGYIEQCYAEGKFFDAELWGYDTKDRPAKAHSLILAACSPIVRRFRRLYKEGT